MTQLEKLTSMSAGVFLREVHIGGCPLDNFASCRIDWCRERTAEGGKYPCRGCMAAYLNSEVKGETKCIHA